MFPEPKRGLGGCMGPPFGMGGRGPRGVVSVALFNEIDIRAAAKGIYNLALFKNYLRPYN